MANSPLRGCPTCGTKVTEAKMGLRDYRWVSESLPGREAPMDLDCVLEKNGNVLVLEFKPEGMALPLGQRITLRALRNTPGGKTRVWLVWEGKDGKSVEVGEMDSHGDVPFVERMPIPRLKNRIVTWRAAAVEEG